jgi:membrane protein required for colicin V production
MNWLDVALGAVLAWSVFTGFRRGLTREAIRLISVVIGTLLAIWFYGTAASFLLPYISSRPAANFAGFLAVFCGAILLGAIVSMIARKFLKATGLSLFDKILGGGFGLLRGGLIGVAVVMGLMAFSSGDKPPSAVVGSRMAPYLMDGARVVVAVAPYELKQGFRKTYRQVKTAWEAALEHGIRNGREGESGAHEKSN